MKRLLVAAVPAALYVAACALEDAPPPPPSTDDGSVTGSTNGLSSSTATNTTTSVGTTGGMAVTSAATATVSGMTSTTSGTTVTTSTSGSTGTTGEPVTTGSGGSTSTSTSEGDGSDGTDGTVATSSETSTTGDPVEDPLTFAAELDNQLYDLACQQDETYSQRVCVNRDAQGQCPNSNDYIFDGNVNKDQTITFGGDPNTTYDVTIWVRGVVEPKDYQGGMVQPGTAFYVGGAPGQQNNYNVYMIRVSDPESDFFLNANGEPLDHATYILDYEASFPVRGGATLQLVASDSNCSAIKNCAAPVNESVCNALTIPSLESDHPEIEQPFSGQFIVLDVLSVSAQ